MPYLHCPNCKCYKYISEIEKIQALNATHECCPFCEGPTTIGEDHTMQIPSPQLPLGFKVPGPKTLKPEADSSKPLGTLVENAQSWLNSQNQYTKVEFKYGRNYIVIAKLKD